MGRKAFIDDLESATACEISGVSDVVRGAEDGEFHFTYAARSGETLQVHALITDISEYPSSPSFVFTESQQAPQVVHQIFDRLNNRSKNYRIHDLISQTAKELEKGFELGHQGSSDDDQNGEDSDFASDSEADESVWSPGFASRNTESFSERLHYQLTKDAASKLNHHIAEDLRTVHLAGFKVGVVSGMKPDSSSSLLSISIQVRKLGLSKDALETWNLEAQQYVVLLMKYNGRYKDFDIIISEPSRRHGVEYRIGVSDKYKPDPKEAFKAFSSTPKFSDGNQPSTKTTSHAETTVIGGFHNMFVSTSLNDFMNSQFVSLLKTRNDLDVDWDTAKNIFNNIQGKITSEDNINDPALRGTSSTSSRKDLPDFLNTDHLVDCDQQRKSFPLIAMQFAMRYFVRCTEYCLICHENTTETFEALKPYVCSKPLCLYQYMSLGFGPSVEHEILTQPNVVDLLVSFCYAGAKAQKIRQYPVGMHLLVPKLGEHVDSQTAVWTTAPGFLQQSSQTPSDTPQSVSYTIKFDEVQKEVLFDKSTSETVKLRPGDWVIVNIEGKLSKHYRVNRVTFPTITLAEEGVTRCSITPYTEPPGVALPSESPSSLVSATLTLYDKNFDDLTDREKANAIVMVLETLPSVRNMNSYLTRSGRSSETSLRDWKERISPAALGLLRWIIASNLSCVMQVEKWCGDDNQRTLGGTGPDLKVTQMEGWVQFRFAQGAPDKEQRFHQALLDNKEKLNLKFPTLFAWHGSAVHNWHSIIRTGLDFKETVNGRAFGNGCYHSQDFNTSLGYSGGYPGGHFNNGTWPNSELRITSAMCLNEIVNLPQEFVSNSPHLVVQHVDWIQCRYLFVRSGTYLDPSSPPALANTQRQTAPDFIEQDPQRTARGQSGSNIGIPKCAVSASKVLGAQEGIDQQPVGKKPKIGLQKRQVVVIIDDDIISDEEDPVDLAFLYSDSDPHESETGKTKIDRLPLPHLTDFVPGTLNRETLPLLAPPSYATSAATNTLTRELRTILKVQETTPSHELGWYIDGNMTDNVYQWIVELHSFDKDLPLAQDMKKAGIRSVVLEVRFGKDYPMSPPFVRVIRPRFLPFMSGGGGHVTAGGALCMELLTNSGWSAVSSLEGVLLQVRMAISNIQPRPARLENTHLQQQRDYGIGEAIEAYIRACNAHGWEVPKDFREFGDNGSTVTRSN